jgi:hypothetical protein
VGESQDYFRRGTKSSGSGSLMPLGHVGRVAEGARTARFILPAYDSEVEETELFAAERKSQN